MKKIDARKLSRDAQQQNRFLAIQLRKKGMSSLIAGETIGVHSSSIRKWWSIYQKKGYEGLILKTRGVKLGSNRKLNLEQIQILNQIIRDKTPDDMKLNFCLWTRRAIQILINNLWNIFISLRTAGSYMKLLGFTPQKAIRRAYEQNPKLIRKWLDKEYPDIAKKARKSNAEIQWVDETGLNSNSNYLRG